MEVGEGMGVKRRHPSFVEDAACSSSENVEGISGSRSLSEAPRQIGIKRSRKGKWTIEEEQFANKLIHFFHEGLLRLPEGTTLRAYIADKLGCDPMRITKKFTGNSRIGKKIFKSCDDSRDLNRRITNAEMELEVLEARFHSKVNVDRKSRSKNSTAKAVTLRQDDMIADEFSVMNPHVQSKDLCTGLIENHALNDAIDDLISSTSWSLPPGVSDATGMSSLPFPRERAPGDQSNCGNPDESTFGDEFLAPFRRPSPMVENGNLNGLVGGGPEKSQMGGTYGSGGYSFTPNSLCSESMQGSSSDDSSQFERAADRNSSCGEAIGLATRSHENPFVAGLGSEGLGHNLEAAWNIRHVQKDPEDSFHTYTSYLVACSGHYPKLKAGTEESHDELPAPFDSKQHAVEVEEASKRASWT